MKRTHIHHKTRWLSLIAMLIAGILACSAIAQTEGTREATPEGEPEATVQSEEPKLEPSEKTEAAADDAEKGEEKNAERGEEINGSADNLERFEKDGITILTGNVKILRTDGYLNADKVTFYTDPVTGDTVRTVAENNVEIRDAEIFATCEHATMNHLTNTIILKTDVVVLQNKDRLETVLFTYNRTTGEQTAEGDVKFKVRVIEAEPVPAEEEPKAAEATEGADETAPADTPAVSEEGEAPAAEGAEKAETDAESDAVESGAPAAAETESADDESADADNQQAEEEDVEAEKSETDAESGAPAAADDESADADNQQAEEENVVNESEEDK